ncbi:hypothetical protein TRIUR3_00780 [Triticum urartu]|uniref:F-box domain-containing protein n=2 Tax=Triticum urartu TaxID=4572 RepID=M7ZZ55_TRIUA|nr:hypothetical protein TRIUR3_00780 [Triticum urartu]
MCTRGPSTRDWSEMTLDALTSVFAKLGAVELLMGAGLVCRSWLYASRAPELWRAVVMSRPPDTPEGTEAFLRAIAKVSSELWPAVPITAIDDPWHAMAKVDDSLSLVRTPPLRPKLSGAASYTVFPSQTLAHLKIVSAFATASGHVALSEEPWPDAMPRHLRERIHGRDSKVPSARRKENRNVYEAISRACSQLKLFVLAHPGYFLHPDGSYGFHDGDVLGIATMKQLRHLSLDCVDINNVELVSIIDSCPYLEHLCMRYCYNIFADEALRAKCARIKTLKLKPMSDETADPNQGRHSDPNDCCFAFFDPPSD